MADLPIPFSGPMVRALLREIEQPGTGKTQTRSKLVLRRLRGFSEFGPSDTRGYDWHLRDKDMRCHDLRHADLIKLLPYATGDRLYVRESWRAESVLDASAPSSICAHVPLQYGADGSRSYEDGWSAGRLRPSTHMPKWASRLTLIATDVRVQRLQDISKEDAIAEGIEVGKPLPEVPNSYGDIYHDGASDPINGWTRDPIEAYAALWNSLNAKRGYDWQSNPWVAAYTFRPILANIDNLSEAA